MRMQKVEKGTCPTANVCSLVEMTTPVPLLSLLKNLISRHGDIPLDEQHRTVAREEGKCPTPFGWNYQY